MAKMGKRDHERIRTGNIAVEFTGADGKVSACAEVINISPGGMCFIRSSMFSVGDILKIVFPLENGKMHIEGRILRIAGREVGVKFSSGEDDIVRLLIALNKEYPTLNIKNMFSLVAPSGTDDDGGIEKALLLDDFDK